jgi:hypothetical protein
MDSLLAEFNEPIEESLWSAMRSLEETVIDAPHGGNFSGHGPQAAANS